MPERQKVVVGAGATGLACARYLRSRNMPFRIVDDADQPPMLSRIRAEMPDVQVETGGGWIVDPRIEDELVLSPGVPLNSSGVVRAIEKGLSITGDISLFRKAARAPLVAITGSNGKSTVTTLVGEIAAASGRHVAVGGNLGTPALDLLNDEVDLYVLELSSFQLELVKELRAFVGTVLNISEDHLNRYSSFNDYCQTKLKIYRECKHLVFNRQDIRTLPAAASDASVRSFGLDSPPGDDDFGARVLKDGWLLLKGRQCLLHSRELTLEGAHNCLNILAGLAISDALELDLQRAVEVARRFEGLPYRCQRVFQTENLQVFNDSKATNVGATIAAIAGIGNRQRKHIVWIAGGVGKGADFSELKSVVRKFVKQAVLFGQDASRIEQAIAGDVNTSRATDLENCVRTALAFTQAGDVILFSPACSSFDMFDDYMDRGATFTKTIDALRPQLLEVRDA